MYALLAHYDDVVRVATDAWDRSDGRLQAALEALPAPVYVTDAEGMVTYFNSACVDSAGRRPAVGKDRWCVSWKLYTADGQALPHDQCPMAVAIHTRRPVRGVFAIAERPNGERVTFTPFPTPIFNAGGALIGAINMLIDATDVRQIAELRSQAARCRRLCDVTDKATIEILRSMAEEYDAKADALEAREPAAHARAAS
jgi:PAS domain-containing protein